MITLNLVYPEKSGIQYKIQNFPDGQNNIVLNLNGGELSGYSEAGVKWNISILIKSRLNTFIDLEIIACAVASLRECGVEDIHLYTPYIIGARSDRKFEEGGNNYLKDVICPIINSLNFKTVNCIDPHSDILEACIKGFKKIDNYKLVTEFILSRENEIKQHYKDFILVSPDAGASKKIYKLAEQIGYKCDIITCSKDRDVDGNLTKTVVPNIFDYLMEGKDFIIVDDICDGGRTFINIAKEILDEQENNPQFSGRREELNSKIYLIVTHGIFSKGFDELSKYFDGIYCTNSYKDITRNVITEKVKQLNVFQHDDRNLE